MQTEVIIGPRQNKLLAALPDQEWLLLSLDRAGLERRTCECYAVVRNEYDRLLPRESAA